MSDDVTRMTAGLPTSEKRLDDERRAREAFYFGSWYGDPTSTSASIRQLASFFGGERPTTPAA
ncbi:MAG: hypothetical protein J4N98_06340 [Chloroflexi bacterium]|nr:hypothetical protein [Chloroflexota bacterium]